MNPTNQATKQDLDRLDAAMYILDELGEAGKISCIAIVAENIDNDTLLGGKHIPHGHTLHIHGKVSAATLMATIAEDETLSDAFIKLADLCKKYRNP